MAGGNSKSIVFVHGRYFKPAQAELEEIWSDALRSGLERDYPDKTKSFDLAKKEMVYFGDLNNQFLVDKSPAYDERLDVADRQNAATALKEIDKRKKFNRYQYQKLPGKTAVKELIADVSSPVLGKLGLESTAIGKLAPEVREYWQPESPYGAAIRDRIAKTLGKTLERSDDVIVVAHCLGAMATYDVLWELSRVSNERKISIFLTLGCALGNATVQKKLAGHDRKGAEKYPANILVWNNIAAEDDYACHDKTIADDYREMLKLHLVSSINDFRIYNMAVRYGKSNPHSSIGYLIHPRVSKLVADWL